MKITTIFILGFVFASLIWGAFISGYLLGSRDWVMPEMEIEEKPIVLKQEPEDITTLLSEEVYGDN